jgi:hypothetical protein
LRRLKRLRPEGIIEADVSIVSPKAIDRHVTMLVLAVAFGVAPRTAETERSRHPNATSTVPTNDSSWPKRDFVRFEMRSYQLHKLFHRRLLKMISMNPSNGKTESLMKRAALILLVIGSLSVAQQASAHGRGGWGHGHGGGNGGAIVGALIGGAVLGALVTSVATAQPTYAQPVYQQPAYAQPVYAQPQSATCYDSYQRAYVPCQGGYGY